jgi:hypothetical protein
MVLVGYRTAQVRTNESVSYTVDHRPQGTAIPQCRMAKYGQVWHPNWLSMVRLST